MCQPLRCKAKRAHSQSTSSLTQIMKHNIQIDASMGSNNSLRTMRKRVIQLIH